eukprot:TRINITY_DN15089_c0_g1_i1.p1 TRINITY_DN15089_c0_g1~~TRINITY_DN15089_c0_g1_i1.p1  ORF type:complete len:483 (+),score=101.55 TRINITY_DN15089_c0_g1_i1:42-1490(+)
MQREASPIKAWGEGDDDYSDSDSESTETSSTSSSTFTSSSEDERETKGSYNSSYYRAGSEISFQRSNSRMSAMSKNYLRRRAHATSETSSECTFAPKITKMGQTTQRGGTWEDRMYYDEMSIRQERKRESDAQLKAHELKQLKELDECTFRPRILDDPFHRDRRSREDVFSDLQQDATVRQGCKKEIERLRKDREELMDQTGPKTKIVKPKMAIVAAANTLHQEAVKKEARMAKRVKQRDASEASQKVQPKEKIQKSATGKLPWHELYEKGLAKQQKRNTNDIPGSAWRENHKRIPNNISCERLYSHAEKRIKEQRARETADPEPLPYTFKPTIRECPARIKKERATYQHQKQLEEKQARLNSELKYFEKQAKRHLKKKKQVIQPERYPGYEDINYNSIGSYPFLNNYVRDSSSNFDMAVAPVDFEISTEFGEGESMELTPNRSPYNRPPIHPPPQMLPTPITEISSEESHPDNVTDEDISD